jgi:hypothetical protein
MSWKWAQVFIVSPKLVPLTMPKKSFLENLKKVELNHVGLYPPQISLLPKMEGLPYGGMHWVVPPCPGFNLGLIVVI